MPPTEVCSFTITEGQRYYVTVSNMREHPDDDYAPVWTLSLDPTRTGWITDSGCNGYGMVKREADFIAKCVNAALERGERP